MIAKRPSFCNHETHFRLKGGYGYGGGYGGRLRWAVTVGGYGGSAFNYLLVMKFQCPPLANPGCFDARHDPTDFTL